MVLFISLVYIVWYANFLLFWLASNHSTSSINIHEEIRFRLADWTLLEVQQSDQILTQFRFRISISKFTTPTSFGQSLTTLVSGSSKFCGRHKTFWTSKRKRPARFGEFYYPIPHKVSVMFTVGNFKVNLTSQSYKSRSFTSRSLTSHRFGRENNLSMVWLEPKANRQAQMKKLPWCL